MGKKKNVTIPVISQKTKKGGVEKGMEAHVSEKTSLGD